MTYKVVLMPVGAEPARTMRIEAHDLEVSGGSDGSDSSHAYYNFIGKPDDEGNAITLAAIPADHIYYVTAEDVTR